MGGSELKRRIEAFVIDWFLIGIAFAVYINVVTILMKETKFDFLSAEYTIAFYLGIAVLVIGKDIFGGRSTGKRIRKLEIRDFKTGKRISIFKALLRNITFMLLGPVELLIGMVRHDNRRLGDLIAGTKVALQK